MFLQIGEDFKLGSYGRYNSSPKGTVAETRRHNKKNGNRSEYRADFGPSQMEGKTFLEESLL